jgi:hypothetical protein
MDTLSNSKSFIKKKPLLDIRICKGFPLLPKDQERYGLLF